MWTGQRLLAAAMVLVLGGVPLPAHHTYTGDYDPSITVELRGSITRLEWVNPHVSIHVTVNKPGAPDETWRIEADAPAGLVEEELTREMLSPGTPVVVKGFPARDKSPRAWGVDITFASGATHKLEFIREKQPFTLSNWWRYTLPIWINEYSAFVVMALPFAVLFIGLYRLRVQARKVRL